MLKKLTLEQLQSMEADPTVAYKLLNKKKVLGIDRYGVNKEGDPSIEYLKWKLFSALPQRPADNKEAREFFLSETQNLWERIQGITDAEEGRIIVKEFMGIVEGSYMDYGKDRKIQKLFGARSRNAMKQLC